ncbi:MAG: ParB/RepB/Spo0J family partition protein [Bacilli bacterium]|nr:ParB/RepB/Spo0J family partition protein [Bacilli bacterium]
MPLPKLDDLFTTEEERKNADLEKIIDIDINNIDDFPEHPFKVIENDEMYNMSESIKENGVLVPVLVRPKDNGRYEMVSGHRRKFASQLANKETIPCIVRELTDDEAIIIMVDSNLQREEILPSEKAFAYKMKLEALSHQGKRSDLTSDQVGPKLERANQILAGESNTSTSQIKRFIRLTKLIPELLELVDNKQIALSPAVELSFLTDEEQYAVLDCIECNISTPSHAQAIRLKNLSLEKKLTIDKIEDILSEEKPNQIPKIKFNADRIRNVLPKNIEEKKIEDYVVNAIEYYSKHLQKQRNMDAR